jgi:hypothetical protein
MIGAPNWIERWLPGSPIFVPDYVAGAILGTALGLIVLWHMGRRSG